MILMPFAACAQSLQTHGGDLRMFRVNATCNNADGCGVCGGGSIGLDINGTCCAVRCATYMKLLSVMRCLYCASVRDDMAAIGCRGTDWVVPPPTDCFWRSTLLVVRTCRFIKVGYAMQSGAVLDDHFMCCETEVDACGLCGGDNTTCAAQLEGWLQMDVWIDNQRQYDFDDDTSFEAAVEAVHATLRATLGDDFPLESVNVTYISPSGPSFSHVRDRLLEIECFSRPTLPRDCALMLLGSQGAPEHRKRSLNRCNHRSAG